MLWPEASRQDFIPVHLTLARSLWKHRRFLLLLPEDWEHVLSKMSMESELHQQVGGTKICQLCQNRCSIVSAWPVVLIHMSQAKLLHQRLYSLHKVKCLGLSDHWLKSKKQTILPCPIGGLVPLFEY